MLFISSRPQCDNGLEQNGWQSITICFFKRHTPCKYGIQNKYREILQTAEIFLADTDYVEDNEQLTLQL